MANVGQRIRGWLACGLADYRRVAFASSLHGFLFVLGAGLIVAIGWSNSGLLAGAFSGFVLVAPVLVTGFHELSRRMEAGEATPVLASFALFDVWRRRGRQLAGLGALLALIGTVWVGFSSVLVRLAMGPERPPGVAAFLRELAYGSDGWIFVWLLTGGMVAAVVFAISALSVPMLVDREVPLSSAIRTSVAATGTHPVEMALWAAVVMALVLVGAVTVVGLVFVLPLLGHATWHAYRDLVLCEGHPAVAAVAPRAP